MKIFPEILPYTYDILLKWSALWDDIGRLVVL